MLTQMEIDIDIMKEHIQYKFQWSNEIIQSVKYCRMPSLQTKTNLKEADAILTSN